VRSTVVLRGALLLALAAGATAPAPAKAAARLDYDASLGAGVEANDNLRLAPDPPPAGEAGPLRTTVFTVSPAVFIAWGERDDVLRLVYQGTWQDYSSGEEDLPAGWIHRLDASLRWRRWQPFFLDVEEQRDRVEQYRLRPEGDELNRTDRNRLSVRPGFAWEVSPTTRLEASLLGEVVTFPGEGDAESVAALFAELGGERRWSPLWSGRASLGFGGVSREIAGDSRELRAELELRQRVSPLADAVYSMAWHRDRAAGGGEESGAAVDRDDVLAGVSFLRRLPRDGFWRVGYQDRLESLADGETLRAGRAEAELFLQARLGSRLGLGIGHERRDFLDSGRRERAWGPSASARWVVTDWLALVAQGGWTQTRGRDPGLPEQSARLLAAGAGLVVLAGRHARLEAGYRHLDNDADLAEESYRSGRWYAVLTAQLRPFLPGRFPESVADRFLTPLP